ncbi:MAG TPA: cupin domain-containing protein [Caulobacteraceae bacterium]|jgi:quercetin dioxygenase-like cupin family protein|nr:cupin domain-containing protein [Caulobacteraceae bacterium]
MGKLGSWTCCWVAAAALTAVAGPSLAEIVTPLASQPLPGVADKTFTAAVVELGPGAHAAPHRHGEAFVYAYVLSGRVRSQLEGQSAHDYSAGQSWTEPPGAHHLQTVNLSGARPLRLLVVFVAPTGAPLKTDDPAP